VNNAEHCDNVIGLDVLVDDNKRRDDADADIRPEGRTRRAALGMTGQTVVELCKAISEFGSDLMACLGIQIAENGGRVRGRGGRKPYTASALLQVSATCWFSRCC
jgi:hypothetical protein